MKLKHGQSLIALAALAALLIGPAPVSAQDSDTFSWSIIP